MANTFNQALEAVASKPPDLHKFRAGQLVTFKNSTVVMVISRFDLMNDSEWCARVYFKSDPRKTAMNFPISMLYPALENSTLPTIH